MPLHTPSQLLPGLMPGASLRSAEGAPAEIGADVGRPYQAEDREDEVEAVDLGVGAARARPSTGPPGRPPDAALRGRRGQPETPPRRIQTPPSTQMPVALHQTSRGAPSSQPAQSAAAQAIPSTAPKRHRERAGLIEPGPFPTGGGHRRQRQDGEGPDRLDDECRQQQRQQDQRRDDASVSARVSFRSTRARGAPARRRSGARGARSRRAPRRARRCRTRATGNR